MSYIGLNPNVPLLNTSTEYFSGNGATTQFFLARNVASASDIDVMIVNTLQRPGVDYDADGVSLQFTSAPGAGVNNITVTYRAGALNTLNLETTAFPAGTEGAPGVYSLAANNSGLYWANASSMTVTVAGANNTTFNANVNSNSTGTGAITVEGGVGIIGNVYTGGIVRVLATTQSGNVSTGAVTIAGGLGVAANLNIGGNIVCVGDFTVNGTFTTTGTDSLDVTDPFIFLANNNVGDTYDSGVVTQYYDGANTRYSGYFRDVSDSGQYKFFGNLLTQPTTTVATSDPSFSYANVIMANVSAAGNVIGTYFIGNGSQLTGIAVDSTQVFNANSKVIIASPNGSIVQNVNGITIATVSSTGIALTGLLTATSNVSATGNIIGANVQTGGLITATGNVTSAANISGGNITSGGIISAVGAITGTAISGTTVSGSGNVTGSNINTGGLVSATGNINGGNVNTAIVSATGAVIATGNVTGGNITTGGLVSATGNINGGNVNTAILSTSGNITASGNITGNYLFGNGSLLTGLSTSSLINGTSNVRVIANGDVTVQSAGTANVLVASTTGLVVTGVVSASGNVTGGNITTGGLITATGAIQSTANVIGGNIITGGLISSTGNVVGGNISTVGLITATGNIQGGNIVTGGLITAIGAVNAASLALTGTITGATTISASGTVTGGNLATNGTITTGSTISATGNITGGNFNTAGLVSVTGNVTATANVAGGNVIATNALIGASMSVSGNVTANNAAFTNIVTAANAVADTNTSQVATTAFVIGQASATTPTSIGTNNVGTSLKYARADHTHTGVASLANGGGITASVTTGSVTLGSTATNANTASAIVARDASGNFAAGTITATLTGAATTAATVTGNAQANITSVGTLTSLSVGSIATTGPFVSTATGNISDGGAQLYLNGTGNNRIDFNSQGTGAPAFTTRSAGSKLVLYPNMSGTSTDYALGVESGAQWSSIPSADAGLFFKWYAGTGVVKSLSGTGVMSVAGNVTTSGNVNAVGLSLSGNVLSAINTTNNITVTTGNVSIPTATANTNTTQAASTAFVAGQAGALSPNTIGTASTGTSLKYAREDHTHGGVGSAVAGTGISVSGATGAVTITNSGVTSVVAGTNIAVSGATGAVTVSVTGTVASATSATTAGTVTTAAQGNITSVGTLTSLAVSGAITVNSGAAVTAIVNGATTGVGNIGSATTTFNTVFAKATTAQYADLAEMYCADAEYAPGTVLIFGGIQEVTIASTTGDTAIAGVVSTNPAHLMNSTLDCNHAVAVALTGRVPTNVVGPVKKGQMMVSAGNGRAMACTTPTLGSVIGKALEDFDGETGTIEVVVGRL